MKIYATNACGSKTAPANYVICDNAATPGSVFFKGPNAPTQSDQMMAFDWKRPAHYAGHLYEMEGYSQHYPGNYEPKFPNTPSVTEWKGRITSQDVLASSIMLSMSDGGTYVFREHALNRCKSLGPYGKYLVYKKQDN